MAVALTRLLALSKSLWDWDEALFCSALREFNVAFTAHGVEYHPHPPGFPLFILAGHVTRLFTSSDFRALQMISLFAAVLLFPATFALARALRMTFVESLSAALLLAFLPSIWFYGGTAFSDIPALVAVIAAVAALFASRSGDRRLYIAGCLLLGISIGLRVQNVLMGAYPWLAASWPRRRGRVVEILSGASIVIAVVAASYGGAALASDSVSGYINAIREHEHYLATTDSFRSPTRVPLGEAFRVFVLDPFNARRTMLVLWTLAAIGALSLRRPAIEALLTFGPFLVFAWLMLDPFGASRLNVAFLPLPALLAALGIAFLVRMTRLPSFVAGAVTVAGTATFVGYYIQWTLPALREARTTDSPPVAASRWIRQHVNPAVSRLYVDNAIAPQAEYLLRDYSQVLVDPDFSARDIDPRNRWVIAEGATVLDGAMSFRRPRGRLWNIARHRYFEIAVLPLTNWVTFGEGWHDGESHDLDVWRWMGSRSVTWLPAVPDRGELRLRGHFPLESLPRAPVVTIRMNGEVVDRFTPQQANVDRAYTVATRRGQPDELTIEIDEVLNLALAGISNDTRDLGFQLKGLSWRPAP